MSVKAVLTVALLRPRGEPAGGDGERPDAAGPKRPGEGLPSDQQTTHPADGRPGGTQRPGHHIR